MLNDAPVNVRTLFEISNCRSAFSFASPKENAGSSEPASSERAPAIRGVSYPLSPFLPLQIANASLVCNLRTGGISISPGTQCHQLKTGTFVLCEKTAKQMQLVGAGLCSARQDTPNYRKSSANPYALTRLAVEADAGHSRSRRRSVTDVGLPLAGTHRPGRMHRFLW